MASTSTFTATRRSLHGVAELLLAGPSFREAERVRLTVEPHGFVTVDMDGPIRRLHLRGTDLVVDPGSDEGGTEGQHAHHHIALAGTFAEVARTAGITAGAPEDLYTDHADVGIDDEIVLIPGDVQAIIDWFVTGDAALRTFARTFAREGATAPEPVLWPEHFDVALTIDEVNYGVSAGDDEIDEPYAYVGPWVHRSGAFWNKPFGAARTAVELGGDIDSLVEFYREGRAAALD